jgi:hypothetical protein
MKNRMFGTVVLLFVFGSGLAQQQKRGLDAQQTMGEWKALEISLRNAKSIHPKNGFVPDESTAVKIGEAAAIAQFGTTRISKEQPLHARLYGNTWIIKGTLHPLGAYGGTAVIKLSKADGKILFMTHQE